MSSFPYEYTPLPWDRIAGEGRIYDDLVAALRTIFDPEIPVNIFDIGLIYRVEVLKDGVAKIRMTLTAPNCPAAESLPIELQGVVADVEGITGVDFELVWEPSWHPEMMSEDAKLELGMI